MHLATLTRPHRSPALLAAERPVGGGYEPGRRPDVPGAVRRLTAAVDELAAADARVLGTADLTTTLRDLARAVGRLEGVQARLVAAAERAGLPERSGATSTTAWVARTTGRSGGQAARTGRLARTTDTTPSIADAVAAGTVGPDQAATLAGSLDRGDLDPDDAVELLESARRLDPGMFRRRARQVAGERHQDRLRARELAAHDARRARRWRDDDGMLHLDAAFSPADGDVVETAIEAFVRPDGAEVPDDQRRTHRQLLADALVDLCRAVLDDGSAGDRALVRPHVAVVVGPEMLLPLDEAGAAGATATSEHGTVLSAAATRKLLCDATFRRVVLDPTGQPLDVGRATRQWSGAQRAAIHAADGGCRGPGCDLPSHRTQLHHVSWWRHGGPTSVDNGAPLCTRHHALVHDDGWGLAMDPVTRVCTWTAPDGSVRTTRPRGPTTDARAGPLGRRDPTAPNRTGPRPERDSPVDATALSFDV